jgi:hypothetical protein
MDTDVKELAARLSRLERSVTRWRALALVAAAAAGVALTAGALGPPGDLTVTSLTVVDKKGNDRIVLDTHGEAPEGADMQFLGAGGKTRLQISTADDGFATVAMNDVESETRRLSFGLAKGGIPVFQMKDSKNNVRFSVGGPDPGLRMRMLDRDQKEVFRAP